MNPSSSGARNRLRGVALLPTGTVLFDSQHPSRRIFRLKRGLMQLSSDSQAILEQLGPGSFFGEKCFICTPRCRQSAIAVSPSEVESFGKSELLQRMEHDPRFSLQLLGSLADRIDYEEQALKEFASEPAVRRLALFLFHMLPARPATGWVRLACNPTNPQLGKTIGATRWRISRLMNQFQRLGWVRREKGLWVEREGLAAFLKVRKPQ